MVCVLRRRRCVPPFGGYVSLYASNLSENHNLSRTHRICLKTIHRLSTIHLSKSLALFFRADRGGKPILLRFARTFLALCAAGRGEEGGGCVSKLVRSFKLPLKAGGGQETIYSSTVTQYTVYAFELQPSYRG